jgi:hypothetical protein
MTDTHAKNLSTQTTNQLDYEQRAAFKYLADEASMYPVRSPYTVIQLTPWNFRIRLVNNHPKVTHTYRLKLPTAFSSVGGARGGIPHYVLQSWEIGAGR